MSDKVCPFCHKTILSDSDTIVGYDNQLYHYDCYMEYEDEMEDNLQSDKVVSCT